MRYQFKGYTAIGRRWTNAAVWLLNLAVVRGSGFLRMLVVTRLLHPRLAGYGFLAISIGQGVASVFQAGTKEVLITERRCDKALLSNAWLLDLGKATVLAGCLWILSIALPSQATTLRLASAIPVCTALASPFTHVLERLQKHGAVALQAMVANVAALVMTYILLVYGMGWASLPLAFIVGLFLQAIVSHVAAGFVPRAPIDYRLQAHIFRKSLPFMGAGLSTYVGTLGVDVILASVGAIGWVAPYRAAMAILQTLLGTLPGILVRASFSADAATNRQRPSALGPAIDLSTIAAVTGVTLVLLPACVFVLPSMAVALYGAAWKDTAVVIPWLAVGVALKALASPMGMAMLSAGVVRREVVIKVAETIGTAIAIALLATRHIQLALAVVAGISLLAMVYRIQYFYRTRTADGMAASRLMVLPCLVSAVTLSAASFFTPADSLGWLSATLVSLGLGLIVGVSVWFGYRYATRQ